jgi:hypothetical protein
MCELLTNSSNCPGLPTLIASAKGASRFVITEAAARDWELVSSDYCAEETRRNPPKLGATAAKVRTTQIAPRVRLVRTSVALDQPDSIGLETSRRRLAEGVRRWGL